MPLISEMPRAKKYIVSSSDFSSHLLNAKRTEGVSVSGSVRAEKAQGLDQDRHPRYEEEAEEDNFEEFDKEQCLVSDMEGSILHRPMPKNVVKTPALPQRSEKRVSNILDNDMLELSNIHGSRAKEKDMSRLDEEDPHELYLSSEEDASLSDDYGDTDSLLDLEEACFGDGNGGSSSRASSRRSQEITATVVSFMVVKPHMIEIHIPTSHSVPVTPAEEKHDIMENLLPSPASASQLRPAMRRPPPLNLQNARPMSMATTSSYIPSSYTPAIPTTSSMVNLSSTGGPPYTIRKSSRLASLVTSTKASLSSRSSTSFSPSTSFSATSTHSFLDSDPFAQSSTPWNPPLTPTDLSIPMTPKSPTSQSAWKKSISRTLSKARKPSLQKINLAYNNSMSNNTSQRTSTMSSATMPTLSRIISNPEPTAPKLTDGKLNRLGHQDAENSSDDRMIELPVQRAETMPVTPSPREAPMRYEDLMKNRVAPPIPESSAQSQSREGRKSFSLGMGLGRKKSLKR